jgi:hypothetical protein
VPIRPGRRDDVAEVHAIDPPRDALSPREVADRTGLSYHAVLRAIDRGELAGKRVCDGARILVPVAAYRTWAGLDGAPEEREPESPRPAPIPRRSRAVAAAGSVERLTALEGGQR